MSQVDSKGCIQVGALNVVDASILVKYNVRAIFEEWQLEYPLTPCL